MAARGANATLTTRVEFPATPDATVLLNGRLPSLAFAPSGEANRIRFARAFSFVAIRAYWLTLAEGDLLLREPPPSVDPKSLPPQAVALAERLGGIAAKFDPTVATYLLARLYAALLPAETRADFGAFYTPPPLVNRLLDMAEAAGVDWSSAAVLDPACGGGAFLTPVALRMVQRLPYSDPASVLATLGSRLRGWEIDRYGAWMAQVFVETAFLAISRQAGKRLPAVVEVCNSLARDARDHGFDLVIGNPPYGRVSLTTDERARFARSLHGHANKYGVFMDLAVRLVRPEGVVAFVTPTSFLAGDYYKKLRGLLAAESPLVALDFVDSRIGVFDDVLQETVLSTYRRSTRGVRPRVGFLRVMDITTAAVVSAGSFDLPCPATLPWLFPRRVEDAHFVAQLRQMPHRLAHYGYSVSTGPLVWNRHKSQRRHERGKGCLPLIWAEAVTATGEFVHRAEKRNHSLWFKPNRGDVWLITRVSCVLVQRTTAKEQRRRLIAAELPRGFLRRYGGAVVENHLNMIRARSTRPIVASDVLAALLNSGIVDRAFRCINGSVAVSAYELEALPLPPPEQTGNLTKLVRNGASKQEVDRECARLYGEAVES